MKLNANFNFSIYNFQCSHQPRINKRTTKEIIKRNKRNNSIFYRNFQCHVTTSLLDNLSWWHFLDFLIREPLSIMTRPTFFKNTFYYCNYLLFPLRGPEFRASQRWDIGNNQIFSQFKTQLYQNNKANPFIQIPGPSPPLGASQTNTRQSDYRNRCDWKLGGITWRHDG